MTPTICRVKHDPPNSYGDCLRACLAAMLDCDVPEVIPHFAYDGCDFDTSIQRLREWLHGSPSSLYLSYFSSESSQDEVMQYMAKHNPDIEYMLFGEGHVVVCRNAEVVCDPAWYRTALKVPQEAWVVGVLVW